MEQTSFTTLHKFRKEMLAFLDLVCFNRKVRARVGILGRRTTIPYREEGSGAGRPILKDGISNECGGS